MTNTKIGRLPIAFAPRALTCTIDEHKPGILAGSEGLYYVGRLDKWVLNGFVVVLNSALNALVVPV